MYVNVDTHSYTHTYTHAHMYSVILQYYHDQERKCLSITAMYYDTPTCEYVRHCGHTYTSCVYVKMKAGLSMTYTVLISTVLVSLVINVASTQIQLQDCPSLVDPTGSGTDSSPVNISDDNYCIIDQCNIRLLTTGELLEVTTLSDDFLLATNQSTQ